MKDEKTTLDNTNRSNEDTLFDNRPQGAEKQNKVNVAAKPNRAKWVKIAGGAGTGLLLGSVATLLMSSKPVDGDAETSNEEASSHEGFATTSASTIAADSIPLANSVSDDMTFEEAFAAARQEHGPGATFVWHGNVYSTYLAEEWQELTAQQQDDYVGHATDNPSVHHTDNNDTVDVISVDVSHVNEPTNGGEDINNQNEQGNGNGTNNQEQVLQPTLNENMEVEVLGVYHEEDPNSELYGTALYGATVDGHNAVLVDVGDDNTIDGILVDLNDDGTITDNEVADISAQRLNIDQFTDQTNPPQNYCIDDNTLPDYTDDSNQIDFNV